MQVYATRANTSAEGPYGCSSGRAVVLWRTKEKVTSSFAPTTLSTLNGLGFGKVQIRVGPPLREGEGTLVYTVRGVSGAWPNAEEKKISQKGPDGLL